MHIITVHRNDLPMLARLWQEKSVLLQHSDDFFMPQSDGASQWIEAAETWLADDSFAFFAAQVEDGYAGYIVGEIRRGLAGFEPQKVGEIRELVLDMHRYHAGVGRQLVNHLIDWFRERHVDRMLISVPRHFPAEQAFWRALGLKHYSDGMWMPL
jgi:GNAT superfamily N-acetyltransferase